MKNKNRWIWKELLILVIYCVVVFVLDYMNVIQIETLSEQIRSFSVKYLHWTSSFLLLFSLFNIIKFSIKLLSYYFYTKNYVKNSLFIPIYFRNKITKIELDYEKFDEESKKEELQFFIDYCYAHIFIYTCTFFFSILVLLFYFFFSKYYLILF